MADILQMPPAKQISVAERILQAVEAHDERRRRARPKELFLLADGEELLRLHTQSSNVKITLPTDTGILSLEAREADGKTLTMATYMLYYDEPKVQTFEPLIVAGFGKIECKLTYDFEENVIAKFSVTPESPKNISVTKAHPVKALPIKRGSQAPEVI